MNIWWVNQGSTYEISMACACLWSPVRTSKGAARTYWNTMAEVKRGDIIVHCSKGKVLALSKAVSDSYFSDRPTDFQSDSWTDNQGRRVDVDYAPLTPAIPVRSVAPNIQELNIHQGPLNKNGMPKQSYLHRFNLKGLQILRAAYSGKWPHWAELTFERYY